MSSPPTISIFEPLQSAWDHTRRMLFEPFDFKKWLIIGFSCFLANLASYTNGGGNYSTGGMDSSGSSNGGFMSSMEDIFGELAAVVLGVGIVFLVVAVVLLIALVLAMVWVSCRGTFMFIDNIAHNQASIAAPWKRYSQQGWQLFYLYLVAVGGFIALLIGGTVFYVILAEADVLTFDSDISLAILIVVIGLLIAFVIAFSVLTILVKAIVIPRMYVQQCGVIPAMKDSWTLFCHYPLEWIAYILVSIGLAIASIVLVLTFCLFTCCIAALPYINQVVMLPMYVFLQAYSLFFVAQFGPEWNVFSPTPPTLSPTDAD